VDNNKQIIKWLNFAKLIAIIAVITNHTFQYLYHNQDIVYASYFSVSLFIIISGMTSYLSNSRRDETWKESIIRGCKKICLTYLISVVIHEIILFGSFDFLRYLSHVVYFNISGPHYYVLLYIQLMIVSRILFSLLKRYDNTKHSVLFEIITFFIIVIISSYTTRYTNILNVYGGAGKVLGGTYLILFYLGMLIMKHKIFEKITFLKSLLCFIVGGISWFVWWKFNCNTGRIVDTYVLFGEGVNPPSIYLMLSAFFVLITCYGFFTILEKINVFSKLVDFMFWLGKHTLYIFLYHELILVNFLFPNFRLSNIWIMRIVVFFVIFVASLLIEYIIELILKQFKKLMKI